MLASKTLPPPKCCAGGVDCTSCTCYVPRHRSPPPPHHYAYFPLAQEKLESVKHERKYDSFPSFPRAGRVVAATPTPSPLSCTGRAFPPLYHRTVTVKFAARPPGFNFLASHHHPLASMMPPIECSRGNELMMSRPVVTTYPPLFNPRDPGCPPSSDSTANTTRPATSLKSLSTADEPPEKGRNRGETLCRRIPDEPLRRPEPDVGGGLGKS